MGRESASDVGCCLCAPLAGWLRQVMNLLDTAGDLSQRAVTKKRTADEFPVTEDGRLDLSRLIDAEAGL